DPLDGGADGAGAGRPRDAGAAHPAGAAAALAAGGAARAGGLGAVVPAAGLRAVRRLAVGALLHQLVRRLARLDVRPRDDARAPGPGRRAVLLAARGGGPGAGTRGLPLPRGADRAHAALPRVPRGRDHGPVRADRWRAL